MSQPKALCHWTDQIKRAFPNLSKPQAKTLAGNMYCRTDGVYELVRPAYNPENG